MIIRDKDNFLPLIAKMLTALNYDKVEMHTGKPYDITAGEKREKKKQNFQPCHKLQPRKQAGNYTASPKPTVAERMVRLARLQG